MTINPKFDDLNKLCERSIMKMSDAEALAHIGQLIDDALDASFERGAKRALYLLDKLSNRELIDTDGALVEYFRANAWAALSHIANVRRSWYWEAPELQAELLALSRASNHAGFASLDKVRRCQILTNHANLLNMVGRTIDAVAVWDAALKIIPGFAMARGNRGVGLKSYAGMVVDDVSARSWLCMPSTVFVRRWPKTHSSIPATLEGLLPISPVRRRNSLAPLIST